VITTLKGLYLCRDGLVFNPFRVVKYNCHNPWQALKESGQPWAERVQFFQD
jgi:hypothetical protein